MFMFYVYAVNIFLISLIASINFGIIQGNYKKAKKEQNTLSEKELDLQDNFQEEGTNDGSELLTKSTLIPKIECKPEAYFVETNSNDNHVHTMLIKYNKQQRQKEQLIKRNNQLQQEVDELQYTFRYLAKRNMKTKTALANEMNHLRDIIKSQNKTISYYVRRLR
eukprot:516951_1